MRIFKYITTNHILSILIAIAMSTCCVKAQQNIPPHLQNTWWLGTLREASLPLNIHFAATEDGETRCVVFSPLQTSEPMEASEWSWHNDTLLIFYKPSKFKMTLCYSPDSSLFTGTFRQGILRTQISFHPSDTLFHIQRPQNPQRPLPYIEEEFAIETQKEKTKIAGTLTIPNSPGPHPVVILISGSGQQNRDEEIMGHKPFLVLSDHLTRNGIAVLRYDDRGVGQSTGEVQSATTLDFANDVEKLVVFLRKDKRIDSHAIGLIGHSEGALIAEIVASRHRKKIAFLVSMAGIGGTGAETLIAQNRMIYSRQGVSKKLVDLRCACLQELFKSVDTLTEQYRNAYVQSTVESYCSSLTKEECRSINLTKGDAIQMAEQLALPWMKTFISIDSRTYIARIQCPILAINGEKDCQVPVSNLQQIKQTASASTTIVNLPELNHLFQHCQTGMPDEYLYIEETVSPDVLDLITQWIKQQIK